MTQLELVTLACMLSGNPTPDQVEQLQRISQAEAQYVQSLDQSTACYDQRLQQMLSRSQSTQTAAGRNTIEGVQPTRTTDAAE